MANVGTGVLGRTLIGTGQGSSPTYVDIGAFSGLTQYGPVIGQGVGAFTSMAAGVTGQVIIGVTGGNPVWGSISDAFVWSDNSGAFLAVSNHGYFLTGASTVTLPASPSQGDVVKLIADTTGSIVITANTGQSIRFAENISSVAGTVTNSARGDTMSLVYRTTGATWFAESNPCGSWITA